MQRVYNYFLQPQPAPAIETEQNVPLLEEIEEVIIEIPKINTFPFLYDEIQACIQILETSIKNTAAYRDQQKKLMEFYKHYTLFSGAICLLSGTVGWIQAGFYIYDRINKTDTISKWAINTTDLERKLKVEKYARTDAYLECWDKKNAESNLTDANYNYGIRYCVWPNWRNHDLVPCHATNLYDMENREIIPKYCDAWENNDFCWLENNFNHSDARCNTIFKYKCEDQQLFSACYDTPYHIFEVKINGLQSQLNHLNGLNYFLRFLPGGLGVISGSLSAYYYYKWSKAHELYKKELQTPNSLDVFIKDIDDLNRIKNLSSRFDISLEMTTVEGLLIYLKEIASQVYLKQKSRLTFLTSDFAKALPRDAVNTILKQANLIYSVEEDELVDYFCGASL